MGSLSNPERRRALQVFATYAFMKYQRVISDDEIAKKSDDEIAKKLGFRTEEGLYQQLGHWGLRIPAWMRDEITTKERQRKARRLRRGSGALLELPPARRAVEPILKALEKLSSSVRELEQRKEFEQDRRFVVKREVPLTRVHKRDELPDGVWRELCAQHGTDPTAAEIVEEAPTIIEVPVGGSRIPPEPLPSLLAAYALSGEPLSALIDKLHPQSEEVDREALSKVLAEIQERLALAAGQLALLMRGGEVKPGAPPGELSWPEIWAVKRIREDRALNRTDEEIIQSLRAHPELSELTKEEYSRLANLPLP
jgi:hypothetical protein